MDELHKEGRYNLMGVSNYTAAEVEEFCKVRLGGKSSSRCDIEF
jgi:diketogulonate reductase-like aldo/keto reductase